MNKENPSKEFSKDKITVVAANESFNYNEESSKEAVEKTEGEDAATYDKKVAADAAIEENAKKVNSDSEKKFGKEATKFKEEKIVKAIVVEKDFEKTVGEGSEKDIDMKFTDQNS